jgi:hypothetical protein
MYQLQLLSILVHILRSRSQLLRGWAYDSIVYSFSMSCPFQIVGRNVMPLNAIQYYAMFRALGTTK